MNMEDITMCVNVNCPIKHSCFRHTKEVNIYRQSYSKFEHNNGKCEYFISNEKEETYAQNNSDC